MVSRLTPDIEPGAGDEQGEVRDSRRGECYGVTLRGTPDTASMRMKLEARMFEPFQISLFRDCVKPGATVLDVGASIGLYTLLASQLVGSNGRIVAIEPDPRAYTQLQANIAANGSRNVTPLRLAAASRHESRTLYLGDQSTVSGLHQGGRPERTIAEEQVNSVPLDVLIGDTHIDIVKIDVEGAELEVLDGMTLTLSRRSSNLSLFVEVHPGPLSAQARSSTDVLELLSTVFPYIRVIDETSKSLLCPTRQLLAERHTIYCSSSVRK